MFWITTIQHQVRHRLGYFSSFTRVSSGYVSREQGEQVFNRLNRFYK